MQPKDKPAACTGAWRTGGARPPTPPGIEIKGDEGKSKRRYLLPSGSQLMVQDGQTVDAGDVLVKIPRETAKQKDITGGLPRVVELFEARRPKEPAVITEVNGLVKFGDVTKSHRKVLVVTPDGEEHEYQLPRGAHVNVREGEAVPQGEASRWSRATR